MPQPPILVKSLVYALKLQDDKYYVGESYNINFRISQHFNGQGSKWTKLYKPLHILEVSDKETEKDLTLRLMTEYGWKNVRGGSWCAVNLTYNPLQNQRPTECML